MAGVVEEVGVDTQAEVDDQVTGEGVAQVMEAQRPPATVLETRSLSGPSQRAMVNVAMSQRRPPPISQLERPPRTS